MYVCNVCMFVYVYVIFNVCMYVMYVFMYICNVCKQEVMQEQDVHE